MGEKRNDDFDFDPEEPDDELSPETFEFMIDSELGTPSANETTPTGYMDDLSHYGEDYEEGARQPDQLELSDAPENESRSKAKASRIVSYLDIKNSGREIILDYLTRFFMQRSYPATFRAIQGLVESQHMSWTSLRSIIELREHWEISRDYWKIRYGGEIIERKKGESALTWRISYEICDARADYDPIHMIDKDWIEDWYRTQPDDPGYFDFLAYVRLRIRTKESKDLIDGLKMRDDNYNA